MEKWKTILQILILLMAVEVLPAMQKSNSSDELALKVQFSTFFGTSGAEDGYAITTDNDGNIIVGGSSNTGSKRDVLVVKFNSIGEVLFSKTFGDDEHDTVDDVAVDGNGNIIIVGQTKSSNFQTTQNALNQTFSGPGTYLNDWGCCGDGFLLILSSNGEDIIYSSFLGGSGTDSDLAVEVDKNNNIFIAGITSSSDFPVTENALNKIKIGGSDIFLMKFSSNATSLLYSSYLGGSADEVTRFGVDGKWMTLDSSGNVLLVGLTKSTDYPTTNSAFDKSLSAKTDAFITKLSPDGNKVLFSSLFGGQGEDGGYSVKIDAEEDIIVVGTTSSTDFPVTQNVVQTEYAGGDCFGANLAFEGKFKIPMCGDGFISKFSANGDLIYSTYLGGTAYDGIDDVDFDNSNNIYVSALTRSSNLTTTSNAFQTYLKGGTDMYFAVLTPDLAQFKYATYFGTYSFELLNALVLDRDQNVYLTGFTQSSAFPAINNPQEYSGGWEMVLIKMGVPNSNKNSSNISGFSMLGIFLPITLLVFLKTKKSK